MHKNSQSGVSLLQVIVSAGLLGIMALAVTQILTNTIRSSQMAESALQLAILERDILVATDSQQRCAATGINAPGHVLTPAAPPAVGFNQIALASLTTPSQVYQPGSPIGIGGGAITMTSLALSNFVQDLSNPHPTLDYYSARITVVADKMNIPIVRRIPITVEVDRATGQITNCASSFSGIASISSARGFGGCVRKRSVNHPNGGSARSDQILWCPDAQPIMIDCNYMDNQAPDAGPLDFTGNASCTIDGNCDTTGGANDRSNLGQETMYVEPVIQQKDLDGDGSLDILDGCLTYFDGHDHGADWQAEVFCCPR